MIIGITGPAYRGRRSYGYQFPGKEGRVGAQGRIKDVLFDDTALGYMGPANGGICIYAPCVHRDRNRAQVVMLERITFTNLVGEDQAEVMIEWLDRENNVRKVMFFKKGEGITNSIPMDPNAGEASPCISTGYKVRNVYYNYDMDECQFYAAVDFASYIPVYDPETGETRQDLFSQSFYEIEASPCFR